MTEPSALHHPLAPTAPETPVEPAEPAEPAEQAELIELARRQAQLVAALVGRAEPPAGCTAAALAPTARTLIRKRWAAVGRHYPVLTAALTGALAARPDEQSATGPPPGEQAGAVAFTAWAQAHRAAGGLPAGGRGDGLLFATHLATRGELPPVAVAEVGAARAAARVVGPPIGGRVRARGWRGVAVARVGRHTAVAVGSARRFRLRWLPAAGCDER